MEKKEVEKIIDAKFKERLKNIDINDYNSLWTDYTYPPFDEEAFLALIGAYHMGKVKGIDIDENLSVCICNMLLKAPKEQKVNSQYLTFARMIKEELEEQGFSCSKRTNRTTTYLTVAPTTLSFTSSGGTKTLSVTTDETWNVSLLPSWCSVTNTTNSSFQIVCQPNTGNARSDWFKVKSGEKEQRIDVEQVAGIIKPSAEIERVWVDHNVLEWYQNSYYPFNRYSVKGMKIHIKFTTNNMYYKTGKCVVWFYYSDGTKLKDYNNSYRTSDGQVSTSSNFTPNYENCTFTDFVIFMPYNELHLGKGSHSLKFDIGIFDHNNHQMKVSDYEYFSMQ